MQGWQWWRDVYPFQSHQAEACSGRVPSSLQVRKLEQKVAAVLDDVTLGEENEDGRDGKSNRPVQQLKQQQRDTRRAQ